MVRRKRRARTAPADKPDHPQPPPPEPVNVVDGIPDRSGRPGWWKILLLALIFAVWVAFLVWALIAGAP